MLDLVTSSSALTPPERTPTPAGHETMPLQVLN